MKNLAVNAVFASVLACASVGMADDNVLGFWDFKDGEVGSAVSTIQNSAGSGSFSGSVQSTDSKPVFSDKNVKARIYTDSTYSEVAVQDPHSLYFNYHSIGQNRSAFIDIANLGTELSKLSNYTVEMFLRYESLDGNRWPQAIVVEKATGSWYLRCGSGTDSSNTQLNGAGGSVTPGSNVWFHVAIVYEETDSVSHAGTLKYYYNGNLKHTFSGVDNSPTDDNKIVRLGYYLNDAGNESYYYRGEMCALRIKTVALQPSQFLALKPYDVDENGTIALMTLDGKTAGDSASSFTLDGGDLEEVKSVTGKKFDCDTSVDHGVTPLYDADVPGKYLFSSHDRSTLISEDWRSLKFTTEGAPNTKASQNYLSVGGGLITIPNLSSAISMQDSYTVEMFIKDEDWSEFLYSRGVGCWDSVHNGSAARNNLEISTSKKGSTSWNLAYYGGVGNSSYYSVNQAKSGSWKDNAWHHIAVVYDGTKHEVTTYLDYVAAGTTAAFTNEYIGINTGWPLYLGASRCTATPTSTHEPRNTYCFRGKIAGFRVVPRALSAENFLFAADTSADDPTVFALNFEEGQSKIGTKISQSGNSPLPPYASYSYGWVYNYLNSSKPEWSSNVGTKKLVKWGNTVVHTNTTSMRLCGIHSITDAEKQGGNLVGYAGTVMTRFGSDSFVLNQNPKSWTMEGFFKMAETDQTTQMPSGTKTWNYHWAFFGKSGNAKESQKGYNYTPSISWGLTTHPSDHRWKLTWIENDGNIDPTTGDAGTGGVEKSWKSTGNAEVFDKRWHHVAVTYDDTSKKFELFVDYESKGKIDTGSTGPVWDGPYDYCFGRGVGGGTNLEGWMDEIRLSRKVLTTEEMIHLENGSGMIVIIK